MMLTRFSVNIVVQSWGNKQKITLKQMKVSTFQQECRRCGTCCLKGGPALHPEDLSLLQRKLLQQEHLVTIRKGEPVFSLIAEKPHPAPDEIIKIKGRGVEWTCMFYDRQNASCMIYEQRPLECSRLQCWNTEELENVAGKNLLSRLDIINLDDPVLPFIKKQREECSLDLLGHLLNTAKRKKFATTTLDQLTNLMNTDLAIRLQAHEKLQFSLELELFYFGRPLFVILKQLGITAREKYGKLYLASLV